MDHVLETIGSYADWEKMAKSEFYNDLWIELTHGDEVTYLWAGILITVVGFIFYLLRQDTHQKDSQPLPDLIKNEIRVEGIKEKIEEIKEFVIPRKPKRFRKRDRVWFYGRRLIRQMEDNVRYVDSVRSEKQTAGKKIFKNIAKHLIGDSSDSGSTIGEGVEGVPAEHCLDAEEFELVGGRGSAWVPPELTYLLRSFHMFGQFDPSIFLEVYPAIETMQVPAGGYLFRIGEPDVNIFVVQSGRIDVTTTDHTGTYELKRVGPGECLTSLLSFIDMLTGNANNYKTVQARAVVDSVVLRLSVEGLIKVFDKRLELLVQVVQMVMARVQRVVFVALHQYLGLSKELIRPLERKKSPNDETDQLSLQMELALADGGEHEMALEIGVRGLQAELDLSDDQYLRREVEVRRLDIGDTIMAESNYRDVALVYVVYGELTLYQVNEDSLNHQDELYTAAQGECVGQLAMLTGEANFYTCKARTPCVVALLSKSSFFSIISETPETVLSLAQSTISRLSPLVRKIDFALDWVHIEGGQLVHPPVYQTDSTYIVLSGRLRGFTRTGGNEKKLKGEYGRGEMVGIVDYITGANTKASYLAVRDSEVCIVPSQLMTFLKTSCPSVMGKLVKILGSRLANMRMEYQPAEMSKTINYQCVAIVPLSTSVPVEAFCQELERALAWDSQVYYLSSKKVLEKFGQEAFSSRYEYRLNSWLNQQEDRHDRVLYECDSAPTIWTKRCFRHADLILILSDSRSSCQVEEAEKELAVKAKRIRKELVLLWPSTTALPSNTRDWLRGRPWLSGHFHVKLPERMEKIARGRRSRSRLTAKEDKSSGLSAAAGQDTDMHSDFARLARHIEGKSLGLVLGGGGARGAAHVGMLRAITDAGIPIDKVGGVSIGAFMGALWAIHRNIDGVMAKSRQWFRLMTRVAGLLDMTYPVTSLFAGRYFNWTLTETFDQDINIEDLWLPFYCVSTNVTLSQERVHRKGCVWRYCRASMSYAWILPPICDPDDGHLLMDGCYVNNVPGDVMLRERCSHIIAVDVTAMDTTDLYNYGDHLSGWWLLWKRLNPFTSQLQIPTQSQIQERLAFVSHYKNLEELKKNPHYEYIQPPVGHFSSAKFELFEEIYRTGYHHGSTFFYGLRRSDQHSASSHSWLPTNDRLKHKSKQMQGRKADTSLHRITDLASIVSSTNKYSNNSTTDGGINRLDPMSWQGTTVNRISPGRDTRSSTPRSVASSSLEYTPTLWVDEDRLSTGSGEVKNKKKRKTTRTGARTSRTSTRKSPQLLQQ